MGVSRFQLFSRYKPMPKIHQNRRSIRLPDYDYTTPGAYLVNICTQNRECLFGEIVDSKIVYNDLGRLVVKAWIWLAEQYPYVELDEFIVMPNHLHGILVLSDYCRGSSRTAPTAKRKPLGRIVGAFKTVSTKRVNLFRQTPGTRLWQRGYYEHVVRNTEELSRIREYIVTNPARWAIDCENPGQYKNINNC